MAGNPGQAFAARPSDVEALAHRVIGLALEVHSVLGPGLREKIYEEAMVVELHRAEVPVLRQVEIGVRYKDVVLKGQRIDLLVARCLVVEVKAVSLKPGSGALDVHKAQTLSYLRAGGFVLGLLLNFHVRSMKDGITRVISSRPHAPPPTDLAPLASRPLRPLR